MQKHKKWGSKYLAANKKQEIVCDFVSSSEESTWFNITEVECDIVLPTLQLVPIKVDVSSPSTVFTSGKGNDNSSIPSLKPTLGSNKALNQAVLNHMHLN